ncbi:MAG: aminomethyl-transferring glycine dehydrogenase, partial [Defluviitaleaceae bacterium]|nr:aminomethyl-transferring glycine dehydrogenase [Defluviitaleaceae bacterium]
MSGYLPESAAGRREMLDALGVGSAEELFSGIPDDLRLKRPLNLPDGKPEMETIAEMRRLAGENTVFRTIFRGAGAYRHYIPAIVRRAAAKEEFVTAYTPYQPEVSQGVLQSIFEFQTMICELTGMDAANASVYDGAAAAAEAAAMCRERGRQTVIMSASAHPHVIETVRTYGKAAGARLILAPAKNGTTDIEALAGMIDSETACVYIQQPNFYGQIERAWE